MNSILIKVALLSLLFATNNAVGTATPTPTIAGSEDIPPPCITPSYNGDDQRACAVLVPSALALAALVSRVISAGSKVQVVLQTVAIRMVQTALAV